MDFQAFAGPTPLTRYLFIAAVVFVCGDILATLFAVLYQNFWYQKVLRPRYADGYEPHCSVIVPCKGVPKNFGKNLEAFFDLDYGPYEVVYVTENEQDPATEAIRSILGRHTNARLVFAGLSTTCAQKNHNLLAGVREAADPEVYVFADSDIKPPRTWLRELVRPLSQERVTVTSGYRWLHASRATLGEQSHAFANVFIYVLFSVASFIGGVGLWGGSMAIRKKEFDDLGVAQKWARSAVDDMSLSQLVVAKRRKGVVVPTSMTHSDELLPTIGATITWFTRQAMFLKAHFKAVWFIGGMLLSIGGVTLILLLPFAVFGSLAGGGNFFALGGGAAVVMYLGELLAMLMYPLLGPMPRFHAFLLYVPVVRVTQGICYFKTVFSNVITWAGVRYHLNFRGDVARVER